MKHVSVLLASLVLAACATQAPRPAPAMTAVEPSATHESTGPGADDLLQATVWTQLAVEHDLVFLEVYRDAKERLLEALNDRNWDALPHDERTGPVAALEPAVVLDVDETVLDNSPYEARLIRDGKSYNDATWADWIKEEKAEALPGAVDFTQFAARHGVRVFYLSNRPQELDRATLENLRKLGFPVQGDAFLGLGTFVKGCELIGSQKTCRRQLIARHYRVLMQFGDQVGDFLTVLNNTPEGRREAVKPYLGWFGERWFVLPNPMYGSWEPAVFNNIWAQPAADRRRAKIAALRTEN